jgi:hypothetical protein
MARLAAVRPTYSAALWFGLLSSTQGHPPAVAAAGHLRASLPPTPPLGDQRACCRPHALAAGGDEIRLPDAPYSCARRDPCVVGRLRGGKAPGSDGADAGAEGRSPEYLAGNQSTSGPGDNTAGHVFPMSSKSSTGSSGMEAAAKTSNGTRADFDKARPQLQAHPSSETRAYTRGKRKSGRHPREKQPERGQGGLPQLRGAAKDSFFPTSKRTGPSSRAVQTLGRLSWILVPIVLHIVLQHLCALVERSLDFAAAIFVSAREEGFPISM